MGRREDVARLAGVSARTVSNVVNGTVQVSPGTRERVLAAIEQLDYRQIDNSAAARDAVRHLLATGRERVVAVGAQRSQASSSSLRLGGFEEAMAGAPRASADVAYVDSFTRRAGADATRRILRGRTLPDALFCFSDLLALGALRALHDAGVSVPEQVAVVGFDDIEDGRYSTPSLTTVSPDKAAIAKDTMAALVGRIGGDDGEPRRILAPHRLVVRESSAPKSPVQESSVQESSGRGRSDARVQP